MTVLDIFSGTGGMSLGLESVGFRTVAFCEVEPFCRAVLEHHWPGVPIHDDVRTLRGSDVGAVDLVAGGFPCQPVSVAGKRQGQSDARWLWPEMFRLVSELRPRWVLAENVPGLRTLGADRVLEDLESAGYATWPLVVGADDVGAPHRRKRVWIVARKRLADADSAREPNASEPGRQQRSRGPEASDACGGGAALADGRLLQPEKPTGTDGIDGEWTEEQRRKLIDAGLGASGVAVSSAGTATDQRASSCAAKAGVYPVAHGDSAGRSAERSSGLLDGERQAPGHDADGRGPRPVGEPTGPGLEGLRADAGEPQQPEPRHAGIRWPARPGEPQHEWEAPRLAYARCGSGDGRAIGTGAEQAREAVNACCDGTARSPEQSVGGAAHGLSEQLVRDLAIHHGLSDAWVAAWAQRNRARINRNHNKHALRAYGNAVVPAVVAQIGRAILATELRFSQHEM